MSVLASLRQRPQGPLALLAIAGFVLGLLLPDSVPGSVGWALAAMAILVGWGALAARLLAGAASTPPTIAPTSATTAPTSPAASFSLAELLGLGTAAWIFVTGCLLAVDAASRIPLLVLASLGLVAGVWHLCARSSSAPASSPSPSPSPASAPDASKLGRILLGVLLVAYFLLVLVGSLNTRGNPFDDHVAYTAFTKRLLDTGDLIEPFSYRRISAYGGQTVLLALIGLRGNLEASDLLDRGVFHIIAILALLSMMKRRRVHAGVAAILVGFLVSLPDLSINSGAGWTGVALFLTAYAFATREELAPRPRLLLVFACCAAACTLRQNYLVPAGLFAAFLLFDHLRAQVWQRARAGVDGDTWRTAWLRERATALLPIAVAAAMILPYAIATFRSSNSFLYPVLLGNMNPLAPTRPTGYTITDELAAIASNLIAAEPIRIWWILAPLMLLAKETRPGTPWRWFLASSAIGLGFLLHGFLISDAASLWRYAFGFMTPLAFIFLVELGDRLPLGGKPESQDKDAKDAERVAPPPPRLRLPAFAIFLVWLAVLAELVASRTLFADRSGELFTNARAAHSLGAERHRGLAETYRRLQAALPAGENVAFLLDDPYWLDYRQHRFFNLDLPGFTAPSPMPSFTDAETWRAYLRDQGIDTLAFVDPRQSTYLFRRLDWLRRLFTDTELWRFMAVRMLDTGDTFLDLAASSKVLFHEQGIYAIDLSRRADGSPAPRLASTVSLPEDVRADRFVRRFSEEQLGGHAWQLLSRRDVLFLPDGHSPFNVKVALPRPSTVAVESLLSNLLGKPPKEPPHRWLTDRSHYRVRGVKQQRLQMTLWVDLARLAALPRLSLIVDGKVAAEANPDAAGDVFFDVETRCRGWCDVFLVSSTISEFWVASDELQMLRLDTFEWDELPAP